MCQMSTSPFLTSELILSGPCCLSVCHAWALTFFCIFSSFKDTYLPPKHSVCTPQGSLMAHPP